MADRNHERTFRMLFLYMMEFMISLQTITLQFLQQVLTFLMIREVNIAEMEQMQEQSFNSDKLMLPVAQVISVVPLNATRRVWCETRRTSWWEQIVRTRFHDADWLEAFRMSRTSFEQLCTEIGPYMQPERHYVRTPVEVDKRIAIAVYKLASCSEYGVVADLFGVHKSTVCKFVRQFCEVVVRHLMAKYVRFPGRDEAVEIASRVQASHKIPQVMGFIGRTHVPITPPTDGHRDFRNCQMWPSYVLQGVVDDRLHFRNISCKLPGSADDDHVLRESSLFRTADRLPKRDVDVTFTTSDGTTTEAIPLMMLGEAAHPALPWLLKPYSEHSCCTPIQESFNSCVMSARMSVVTTFDRLKARWSTLQKRMDMHYTFSPTVVATCCILHNFVESRGEVVFDEWIEAVRCAEISYPQPPQETVIPTVDESVSSIREALVRHMERSGRLSVTEVPRALDT